MDSLPSRMLYCTPGDVMSGEEQPDKKKRRLPGKRRRLIRIAGSVISLALLTFIAITLITGRQSGLLRFFGFFSDRTSAEIAGEYHFDVGRGRVFAELNGALAAAGTMGIQVLDAAGGETLRDSFRMTSPAVCASEGRAVAFDINGPAARVFSKTEIIASIDIDGSIVSASINRNGWFAVCSQEGGTSRGAVTVYNDEGRDVYRVNLATGYVLSAA